MLCSEVAQFCAYLKSGPIPLYTIPIVSVIFSICKREKIYYIVIINVMIASID